MLHTRIQSAIITPSRFMRDRAADPYPERIGAHHEAPFSRPPVLWRVACWPYGAPFSGRSATSRHPPPLRWGSYLLPHTSNRWPYSEGTAMPELTAERARELLSYDPETGDLTWISHRGNRVPKGATAGVIRKDRRKQTGVDGVQYYNHRLAWLLVTGEGPKQEIDHINGDKSDNRLVNLRDVSRSTNMQNLRGPRKGCLSGFLGVTFNRRKHKYHAHIYLNGKRKRIGTYSSPAEAHQAYLNAKRQLHAGCTL